LAKEHLISYTWEDEAMLSRRSFLTGTIGAGAVLAT
jgi:hypothetical protein